MNQPSLPAILRAPTRAVVPAHVRLAGDPPCAPERSSISALPGALRVAARDPGSSWSGAVARPLVVARNRLSAASLSSRFPPWKAAQTGPVVGPDGNVWFVETDAHKIARITHAGAITEFALPTTVSAPIDLTAGPDGALWFTDGSNKIGRLTPDGKQITAFPLPAGPSAPDRVTTGPDGNLWFTAPDFGGDGPVTIGRMTPTGMATEFPLTTPHLYPQDLIAGPDGNVWFTEGMEFPGVGKIGSITPGKITEFAPVRATNPHDITRGPDGALWFSETSLDSATIGRLTPAGKLTTFPLPQRLSSLGGITAGPDGNVWFAETTVDQLARITPTGAVTEFTLHPSQQNGPTGITTGPDGKIGFTEDADNKIGRLT